MKVWAEASKASRQIFPIPADPVNIIAAALKAEREEALFAALHVAGGISRAKYEARKAKKK